MLCCHKLAQNFIYSWVNVTICHSDVISAIVLHSMDTFLSERRPEAHPTNLRCISSECLVTTNSHAVVRVPKRLSRYRPIGHTRDTMVIVNFEEATPLIELNLPYSSGCLI